MFSRDQMHEAMLSSIGRTMPSTEQIHESTLASINQSRECAAQDAHWRPEMIEEELLIEAEGQSALQYAVGRINECHRRLDKLIHDYRELQRLARRRVSALEYNWLNESTRLNPKNMPYVTLEGGVTLYNVVAAPICGDRPMPANNRPTWFWTDAAHAHYFAEAYVIGYHSNTQALCRLAAVEEPLRLLRLNEDFSWSELRVRFGLLTDLEGSADDNHERIVQELFLKMDDIDGVMDERVSIGPNLDIEIILNLSESVRDKLRVENHWAIERQGNEAPRPVDPATIQCVGDTLHLQTSSLL